MEIDRIKCFVKHHYSKIANMDLYIGYIVVYDVYTNKYSYSKYTSITRINYDDALNDAKVLKRDILTENDIFENEFA